jgi:predicted PolB exonuclease-like 3'-5' exonuclease
MDDPVNSMHNCMLCTQVLIFSFWSLNTAVSDSDPRAVSLYNFMKRYVITAHRLLICAKSEPKPTIFKIQNECKRLCILGKKSVHPTNV